MTPLIRFKAIEIPTFSKASQKKARGIIEVATDLRAVIFAKVTERLHRSEWPLGDRPLPK